MHCKFTKLIELRKIDVSESLTCAANDQRAGLWIGKESGSVKGSTESWKGMAAWQHMQKLSWGRKRNKRTEKTHRRSWTHPCPALFVCTYNVHVSITVKQYKIHNENILWCENFNLNICYIEWLIGSVRRYKIKTCVRLDETEIEEIFIYKWKRDALHTPHQKTWQTAYIQSSNGWTYL